MRNNILYLIIQQEKSEIDLRNLKYLLRVWKNESRKLLANRREREREQDS